MSLAPILNLLLIIEKNYSDIAQLDEPKNLKTFKD